MKRKLSSFQVLSHGFLHKDACVIWVHITDWNC